MNPRSNSRGWTPVALAALAGGGLVALLGLVFLVLGWLQPGDADQARAAAERSALGIADEIGRISQELVHETVVERALQVPDDAPRQTAALAAALADRGVVDLVDLQVYPPRAEEIEVGTYPDPDFAAVQMLIEARRQDMAGVRLQLPGTDNEHLAFARAVPGEDGEAAAIVLLRMPVEMATERLESPNGRAWIRLSQRARVIRALPPQSAEAMHALGSEVIEGSTLAVEWGVPPAAVPLPPAQATALVFVGLVLLAGGLLLRFVPTARPGRRKSPPPPAPVAPSPSPDQDTRPEVRAPPPAPPRPEPKPDLPDWLLDDGEKAGDQPFVDEPGKADRAGSEAPEEDGGLELGDGSEDQRDEPDAAAPDEGGLDLDVPDLDDILREIEQQEEDEPAPTVPDAARTSPQPAAEPAREPEPDAEADRTDAAGREEETAEDRPGLELEELASLGEQALDEIEPSAEEAEEPAAAAESNGLPDFEWTLESAEAEKQAAEIPEEAGPVAGEDVPDRTGEPAAEPETPSDRPPQPPPPAFELESRSPEQAGESESPWQAVVAGSEPFAIGMFHESGIRGVVDRDLDVERATLIGQAAGTLAMRREMTTCVVGRDGRVSGPLLMSALIRGLRSSGVHVIEAGAVPTPALWFAAHELTDGCGIMVTASHHPADQNGFLVMLGGELLGRDELLEMAALAVQGDLAEGEGDYRLEEVARDYAARLADQVEIGRPLKVVIDCGNGIAGSIAPVLFEALGVDLIPLYCDVDGNFPNHAPDTSEPEFLEDLRLCVRNFQADVGIGFDGDGDRLALVASDSEVVSSDRVGMLLARHLLPRLPGSRVVMDVRCAAQLGRVIESAGGEPVFCGAGALALSREVPPHEAVLGVEMDGQIIVSDRWYPFGDALYAAARVLEALADGRRSVADTFAELPEFLASREMSISCDRGKGQQLVDRLLAQTDFGPARVTDIDGVRVDFDDCWGLIRLHPDEDLLLLRMGGDDPASLNRIKNEFRKWLLALDPDLSLPY